MRPKDRFEIQLIGIDNIMVDHGLQSRFEMHKDYVHEFSDAMVAGAVFPPLVVFFDGKVHWLADGFHRHEAARLAKFENIRCEVRKGSRRDAIIYSAGANKEFVIPRSGDDKRKATRMLFDDSEWFAKDATEIARHVGVKVMQVHAWRLQFCKDGGIKPLPIDVQKTRGARPSAGMTPAQRLERERIAWEMSKGGATHREIAEKLGVTRRAVGIMLERLEARVRGELSVDIQRILSLEPDAPADAPAISPEAGGKSHQDGRTAPAARPGSPSWDEFDPTQPVTSPLRMMCRGSRLDRVAEDAGILLAHLQRFANGQATLTLESADKLAVRFGLRLIKGS